MQAFFLTSTSLEFHQYYQLHSEWLTTNPLGSIILTLELNIHEGKQMNTTYNVVKQGTKKFAVVDADGKVFKMFRVKRDAELHAVACNADNTVYDEEAFDVAEPELVEAVVEVAAEAVVEVAAAEAVVEVAAAEVVVETKKLVADVTGPKKSQRVRARIAQAKLANEAQDIVIAWTVAELGMTRQLARAYVLGNWNKV